MSGKDERRGATRYGVWFPLQLNSEGDSIIGISRDISERGVAMVVAAAPTVGASVKVHLSLPGEEERVVQGKVLRVEENAADAEGLWRHRVAIEFDEPVEALAEALEEIARNSVPPPAP